MKNSYPLVYSFFALFFILLVSVRSDVIQDSCDKAAKGDPTVKYDACVAILEGNPKAKTATSTVDLVPISIEMSIANATSVSSIISKLLEDKSLSNQTRSSLKVCSEVYSEAEFALQTAKQAFKAKDYATTIANISGAQVAPETCEDGFSEAGLVSPLTKENSEFIHLTTIPLDFVIMIK